MAMCEEQMKKKKRLKDWFNFFSKCANLLCCREREEKVDATFMSVM